MGTFKAYLQGKNHSKSNIEKHYYQLHIFIDWCDREKIESEFATYNEILGYLKYLQKREIKQNSLYQYLNSVNHYFNWLLKEERREENPCSNIEIKGIKRRQLYNILNRKELEKLYHDFKIPEDEKHKNQNWYKNSLLVGKRNRVIIGLMIWQGATTRALAKMEMKDIDLRAGTILIKGERRSNERILKLDAQQILDLMEYSLQVRTEFLKVNQKESELLIVSSGKSYSIMNVMGKLMKKLKVQNPKITSTKQIRASVITYWLKNYNLRETQYKAGHRYVSSTEAYLVNDLDDLQEDILKFHPL